ncbi:hypothetical protein ANN_23377 [Periplaneta americana]|uniref:Uncharacterized protein n=1 Tax=Periplaneta americana TaxID=6978 RepID=A0ABQ8SLZ1_PERAM|nr:hypothetical protein ANN_23377 [Periplaneta americana]
MTTENDMDLRMRAILEDNVGRKALSAHTGIVGYETSTVFTHKVDTQIENKMRQIYTTKKIRLILRKSGLKRRQWNNNNSSTCLILKGSDEHIQIKDQEYLFKMYAMSPRRLRLLQFKPTVLQDNARCHVDAIVTNLLGREVEIYLVPMETVAYRLVLCCLKELKRCPHLFLILKETVLPSARTSPPWRAYIHVKTDSNATIAFVSVFAFPYNYQYFHLDTSIDTGIDIISLISASVLMSILRWNRNISGRASVDISDCDLGSYAALCR